MPAKDRLIVALDTDDIEEAERLCGLLEGKVTWFKVGLRLYLAQGKRILNVIKDQGASVFLDLKLHDIPDQVAGASRQITKLGVDMFTVHTLGGPDMMRSAVQAARQTARELDVPVPLVLGVTILTSLDDSMTRQLGFSKSIGDQVVTLAKNARGAGLGGVVASPNEVAMIRQLIGVDLAVVTPGIRLSGDSKGDQKRVAGPGEAIRRGASYLVVGRSVTESDDPSAAVDLIIKEIEEAPYGGSPASSSE